MFRHVWIAAGAFLGIGLVIWPVPVIAIGGILTVILILNQYRARAAMALSPERARRLFEQRELLLAPLAALVTAIGIWIATTPIAEPIFGAIAEEELRSPIEKAAGAALGALVTSLAAHFFGGENDRFSPALAFQRALQTEFGRRVAPKSRESAAIYLPMIEGEGTVEWERAGRRLRADIIEKWLATRRSSTRTGPEAS
ncbi:MAG: hypothetical protein ACTS1X_05240 [Parasphingopyxis sp.]|uniref:hypothetical protein n=1 Tax=Parasphingopyxis sp. TaxID=1920299 RepID=UPI003F9EF9F7